jgi:hypothetical protein
VVFAQVPRHRHAAGVDGQFTVVEEVLQLDEGVVEDGIAALAVGRVVGGSTQSDVGIVGRTAVPHHALTGDGDLDLDSFIDRDARAQFSAVPTLGAVVAAVVVAVGVVALLDRIEVHQALDVNAASAALDLARADLHDVGAGADDVRARRIRRAGDGAGDQGQSGNEQERTMRHGAGLTR